VVGVEAVETLVHARVVYAAEADALGAVDDVLPELASVAGRGRCRGGESEGGYGRCCGDQDALHDDARRTEEEDEMIGADLLLVLTDVEGVLTDFGGPAEKVLRDVSVAELSSMWFPAGSMGPKVAAVCAFTQRTGRRSAIGSLEEIDGVLAGTSGTQVRS
jgi:hypothetical protein